MRYWFLNASSTQCEVMTAIQLDYRFEVNNFDSMWLIHAKNIGFTKVNQVQYELPSDVVRKSLRKSTEHESSKEIYNVQHICNKLNALAIPQGKSVFDRIGCINDGINIINEKDIDRWANIREELIFRKFYGDIEKEYCKLKKSKTKDGKDKTLLHRRQSSTTRSKYPNSRRKELKRSKNDSIVDGPTREKRKLWESSDAGVEFYFQKGRGNKKSLRTKNGSDVICSSSNNALTSPETAIDYPSLQVYEESARLHRLSTIASTKEENLVSSFEDWKFLISTNHSLLFYGVGSKKNILHRFADQNLDGDICEIDGFDHDVTVDGILQLLIDRWLGGQELSVRKKNIFHVHYEKSNRTNTRSITTDNFRIPPFFPYQDDIYIIQKAVMVAKNIAKEVMRTSRPVTLIIHNIDGISLCDNRSQEVLAALVSQSRTDCGLNAIRLIASVDHINGQEVFMNSNFRHRLHWLWKEVHTLRPYIAEVLQEQAVLENYQCFNGGLKAVRAEGKRNIEYYDDDDLNQHESIFSVLKSLASTHAESLRQLAWLHLNTKKEWVSYIDILQRCRSERIVQADHQLRLYLGELLDHNILERNNNSTSSTTSYRIPHSDKILNLIWEFTVN
eukprot:CAMPEP_0170774058 /NCGR_PEP_ID=MMETSP0733-20121128/9740_1 /TAXON_ID=186038 /ORGANISM="Fragilariopsis kerguelensis, Strain L26-C5" /LENGTH=616 /DNA_ID=CAMNT_0011116559 /DNA_START=139 /DNA_END=1989 /DNA_ORIENTATION=+